MSNIIVIVDLETTGLDSNFEQIIEIGAIKVNLDTGVVIDEFQMLTKPDDNQFEDEYDEDGVLIYGEDDDEIETRSPLPFKLDPLITKITGITDEMISGAPRNKDAVDAFFKFSGDLEIWAFNSGFDSKFLNNHTNEHKRIRDILAVAKKAFPNLKSYKLSKIARHLNIASDGAHRAIADCLMAKEILLKALPLVPQDSYVSHHHFKASDYAPKAEGIFFGKTIVFTGALVAMTRDGAAKHASYFGFKIGSSVTKKTNYLVVGIQDLTHLAGHDRSSKHRRAEELNAEGFKIEIITENDFIKLCGIDI